MTRYRLIAETSFDAPTNAEAKSWFADRIDGDAMPFTLTISADEESAKPYIGPDHPCARAAHALNELLQVGVSLEEVEDLEFTHLAGTTILEKCGFVMERLAEALALLEHNERAMAYMRAEQLQDKSEAMDSYLKLYAEYEADKKLWATIEAWNSRLVSQIGIIRAARPLSLAPRGVTETETAPHSLRISQ